MKTPGLEVRVRADGRVERYWVAPRAARKSGFSPKTARIPDAYDDSQAAIRCAVLQAEAFQWMRRGDKVTTRIEHVNDGTVRWICTAFETDEDSPYRAKRKATQTFYSNHTKKLVAEIGDKRLDEIVGRDLRRWYREWAAKFGERTAYGCIQTLRRVVGYGISDYSHDGCVRLGLILSKMAFSPPAGRRVAPTYEQVAAFRAAALEAGLPSLALAQALQFEVGLRQKDVIGETVDGVWMWGLTWEHIDAAMVLRKPTSKSNGEQIATFDLKRSPDLLEELQRIPRGIGPTPVVVRESTGQPWTTSEFSRAFRRIARKAGWPDTVWNMDSRAGAVSEAFEAGAAGDDVMKLATHTRRQTTEIYNRGALVQANRVTELRQANRKPKPT